ncbi:MAG TPA: cytochrome c3 family protein [Candidatus Deferrimicrobiaceae bacterium]|jgi:predicted CXXCH cytochrome family protein
MTQRILAALLFCLLFADTAHAISVGDTAPPFIGNDTSGSTQWVKRYFGHKVIILSFDSTFSTNGADALRAIEKVRALFPSDAIQVLSVNVDANSPARIQNFYAVVPPPRQYSVLIDDKWDIARMYGIDSAPTHLVIDRKGIVRYISNGAEGRADQGLESAVREAVTGKKQKPEPKGKKKRSPLAGRLNLVAPSPFTKTLTGMITVAGTAPERSTVTVSTNGGSPKAVTLRDDTFFIRQPLVLAANFIEVLATGPDGVRRQQGFMVFREADAGTGIVSAAPAYHFHVSANEAPCRRCHDVTPSEEKAKGLDPKSNPCLSCHKEMSDRKIVHGPIAIGGCSSCHRFKGGDRRYALNAEGAELCFECHDEIRNATNKPNKHEPASEGRCTACHDPHGSQEKFQLRRYISDLCYSCHEGVQPLGGKSTHEPYQKGQCNVCHLPHGSSRDDKLLRLPGDRQCLSCHPDLPQRGHVHPSGTGTRMKLPENIVLDNEGRLLCLSCHEPHESGEIKLLQKGGCERCHEKKF